MARKWWPSNPLEEASAMKIFFIRFLILILMYLVGAFHGTQTYNQPITSQTIRIAEYLCAKNDGVKHIRRSYWTNKIYVIHCNDTAIFDDVHINIINKKDESK